MRLVTDSGDLDASTLVQPKILVVNDAPDFLEFMREFLTFEGGYDVATLDQSEGVIEQCTSARPDLLILDIVFRGSRSGYDVAESLASAAATAGIPILFCTALSPRDIPDDIRALIDQRQQRILFKPFDVDDLLTHIDEMLSAQEASRS